MSPWLLLLLLAGSSHGTMTPTRRPTPRMIRSPTPAPSLSAPTLSYVVTTHYTDSNCSAGAFHQSVEALGGCFVAFSADGSQDATGSVQSVVANSSADPLTIVTSTYSFSVNCSGNATQSEEPLQTEVCLPSSQFAGASYVTEISSHASAPSISLPGPLYTTAYFSSQADCGDRGTATKVAAFAADACIPSDAGGSVVYHNPLRPLRVDYLTPNCTGQGSIVDFTELSCLSIPGASSSSRFYNISFPLNTRSTEMAPGFVSTTTFNNRTGQAYQQELQKYDSSKCDFVYSFDYVDDYTPQVAVQSVRTYVGRLLPGPAKQEDYYQSTASFLSLDCSGPFNVTSSLLQSGEMYPYYEQLLEVYPKTRSPPALSIQGLVNTKWVTSPNCGSASDVYYQQVSATGVCFPTDDRGAHSALYLNNFNYARIHYFASSTCQKPRIDTINSDSAGTSPCKKFFGGSGSYNIVFTSPTRASVVLEMYYLDVAWYLRVSVAAVGILCGLVMMALLIELGKWSDFNCIVFALAVLQIFLDATYMADQHRDTPRPEWWGVGNEVLFWQSAVIRFYFVTFFRFFFIIATSYTSNLLTISVVYIVTLQRSIALVRHLRVPLAFAVFAISFVPSVVYVLQAMDDKRYPTFRGYLFPGDRNQGGPDGWYEKNQLLIKCVRYVSIASVCINVGGLFYIGVRMLITARLRGSEKSRHVILEISKRLSIYPLVQVFTLVWGMWYDFYYYAPMFEKHHEDDEVYFATPDYSVCWLMYSLLAPSGGIWFLALLIAFSAEIRARLYVRYCRLVGTPHTPTSAKNRERRLQEYIRLHSTSVSASTSLASTDEQAEPHTKGAAGDSAVRGAEAVCDVIPAARAVDKGRSEGGAAGSGTGTKVAALDATSSSSVWTQRQREEQEEKGLDCRDDDADRAAPPPALSEFDEDELAAIVDRLAGRQLASSWALPPVWTQGGGVERLGASGGQRDGAGGMRGGGGQGGGGGVWMSGGRAQVQRGTGSVFQHADSFGAGHAGLDLMMVDNPLASGRRLPAVGAGPVEGSVPV